MQLQRIRKDILRVLAGWSGSSSPTVGAVAKELKTLPSVIADHARALARDELIELAPTGPTAERWCEITVQGRRAAASRS